MAKAPPLASIERTTLNELAYDRLKRAILSGRIECGMILTLRQLASELGTSMMPVREAVTRLSAEQALAVMPNRGIAIPPLSDEEAEDLWRLRIYLEGETVAQAAKRAGEGDRARITRRAELLNRAILSGDMHKVLECNYDFQFAIFRAAASPISLRVIEMLRMRSLPHWIPTLRMALKEKPPFFDRSLDYHAELAAAIVTGDAKAARRIKRADLKDLRRYVKQATGILAESEVS